MSARLENTPDDIDDLVGAKIVKAWITPGEEYSPPAVRIRVMYRKGLLVNGSPVGEYELWQDEEGNGPGYLAFMGTVMSEVPS